MNHSLLNDVFFSECLVCKQKVSYKLSLCDSCLQNIKTVKHFCDNCGHPSIVKTKYCKFCNENNFYDKLNFYYWYNKEIRALITNIKFRYGIKSIFLINELISDIRLNYTNYNLITSVPSHIIRKFTRFIHPAEIMATILSKKYSLEKKNVLSRIKNTEFQWKHKKNKRALNIKNAFICKKNLSGLKILLVDDIITTGSTLNECAKVLKKSGAVKVDALALARGVYR